jgi:hypothetical protein
VTSPRRSVPRPYVPSSAFGGSFVARGAYVCVCRLKLGFAVQLFVFFVLIAALSVNFAGPA